MSDILENNKENLQVNSEEVTQEVAPELVEEAVEATTEEKTGENSEVFSEEVNEFLEEESKAEAEEEAPKKKHLIKNRILREIVSWIGTILLAVIIAIVINTYIFRISRVSGDSMLKTYYSGETVFVSKLPYVFGEVDRNDVIILDSTLEKRTFFTDVYESLKYNALSYKLFDVEQPKKYFIKRVIAVGGDTLQIKEDGVYVNGKLLDEPYVNDETKPIYNKVKEEYKNGVTVPDDHVFVMGDNRNNSRDSRDIGFVPVNDILGKVIK